ncbi:unnamed protein product [Symbiodinium sp. KB8]|nr:unnamed protein product [Symbiodinium sp. KB8]
MPAKTIYKEVPVTKVQHVIQKRYYDCVAGFKNWHFGWSKTKKSWCCSHEQRDDDASLPPEYRHGDTIVGGDDESLPPEYRHGDMGTYGDDDSVDSVEK